MAIEKRSGEKEYDPMFHTAVTRMGLEGRNKFGRPVGVEMQTSYFPSIEEAQKWILEGPEHYHRVMIPFPGEGFSAWLEKYPVNNSGVLRIEEYLIIEQSGKKGISPRNVKNHHGAQTKDGEEVVNIIVHVGEEKDAIFERGLAWIPVRSSSLLLNFVLNPKHYSQEELQEAFVRVNERAQQVLKDLRKGLKKPISKLKPINKNPRLN